MSKKCQMLKYIVRSKFRIMPTLLEIAIIYILVQPWKLNTIGWISFTHVDCGIVWIPDQYRTNLVSDETLLVISCNGFNQISLVHCVYGENWSKCWSSHSGDQASG